MNAPELKPCPFCGGKPYLANVAMAGCAYVACTDCRMQSDDGGKDRVVAAWNRRADLPPTDADYAALQARVPELEAKLAKAVGALRLSRDAINGLTDSGDAFDDINAALAELTGEDT